MKDAFIIRANLVPRIRSTCDEHEIIETGTVTSNGAKVDAVYLANCKVLIG